MKRIRPGLEYLAARLSEPSTWQGIGFVAGLFFSRARGLDWGQAAGAGGVISAILKMIFPDAKPERQP
jgi:hypothetical protein